MADHYYDQAINMICMNWEEKGKNSIMIEIVMKHPTLFHSHILQMI